MIQYLIDNAVIHSYKVMMDSSENVRYFSIFILSQLKTLYLNGLWTIAVVWS